MNRELLTTEIESVQKAMKGGNTADPQYEKRIEALARLQELDLKEREFELKEKTETSKAQAEWRTIEVRDKEAETKSKELVNKDKNDKRQVALSYAKILIGTAGTVGSILLVTACEEEKIIRSKAYGFVKNFAMRFI